MINEIKQKLGSNKQENKNYLLSVHNDFLAKCKDKNQIAEFLQLLLNLLDDNERRAYIKRINSNFDKVFQKLNEMFGNKNWLGIIKLVDEKLPLVTMPREVNSRKQFQFTNTMFTIAYALQHREEKIDSINSEEFALLNRKIFALIKLKRFNEALEIIEECRQISPDNFGTDFQKIEVYKQTKSLYEVKQELDKLYPKIWHATSFANLLREYAWYYQEKKEYDTCVNYLYFSLKYDDSYIDVVEQKLAELKQCNENIKMPNKTAEVIKYFVSNGLNYQPTKEMLFLAFDIYDYIFAQKQLYENIKDLAKQNLVKINRNATEVAELIEVKHSTPNRLVVDYNYGFTFQVEKTLEKGELASENNELVLHCFKEKNNAFNFKIAINKTQFLLDKSNTFESVVVNIKDEFLKEENFVDSSFVELLNGLRVNKIQTTKKGDKIIRYYFKLRPNIVAYIETKTADNKDCEGAILTVLSTLKYLGVEENELQKVFNKIYLFTKGLAQFTEQEKNDVRAYISKQIISIAKSIISGLELSNNSIIVCENFIKGVLMFFLEKSATIEDFSSISFLQFLLKPDDISIQEYEKKLLDMICNINDGLKGYIKDFLLISAEEKLEFFKVLKQNIL